MPGIDSSGLRRTAAAGSALLRYAAGDSLATATFSRASTATYSQFLSDTLLRYQAGGSLSAATFARASVATFTANA